MDSVAAEAPLNAVGMGMSTGLKSGPIMQEEAVMAVPSRMARVMYWFGRIMAFCLFLNGFKGGFYPFSDSWASWKRCFRAMISSGSSVSTVFRAMRTRKSFMMK